ncbi:MAG TPA: FAD-binding oxidoreductase [archaeon]|nr:FAD-binding oxidoreductase [archaeon]
MEQKIKILMTEFVTHDVKRFILEKPQGYKYLPGQAVDLSINNPKLKGEKRPFTFTSMNSDLVLEFTIKRYADHKGVTEELHKLKAGNELIIEEPFGTINFQGKGVFIAGGAGITPFIAILRDLKENGQVAGNSLIFSNKTQKDIILEKEFTEMFRENPQSLVLTLTNEKKQGYKNRFIDKTFLQEKISDFKQSFYICGPPPFVEAIKKALKELGANPKAVVFEK